MNKPRVEIHSQGPEGNIYFIIGKARDALRRRDESATTTICGSGCKRAKVTLQHSLKSAKQ